MSIFPVFFNTYAKEFFWGHHQQLGVRTPSSHQESVGIYFLVHFAGFGYLSKVLPM